jgi:hypothetical protein
LQQLHPLRQVEMHESLCQAHAAGGLRLTRRVGKVTQHLRRHRLLGEDPVEVVAHLVMVGVGEVEQEEHAAEGGSYSHRDRLLGEAEHAGDDLLALALEEVQLDGVSLRRREPLQHLVQAAHEVGPRSPVRFSIQVEKRLERAAV